MWSPCYASVADARVELGRFGHSATAVDGGGSQGQLVVVYGGVAAQRGPDGATLAQKALGDVLAMQVGTGTWTKPDVVAPAPGGPGPRAFHCAAASGHRVLVFGGHILALEAGRKRRIFFNDLWALDADDWEWRRVELAPSSPAPAKRDMAALLGLPDGRLLLFGGRSEAQRALNDVWAFDPATNTWAQLYPEGSPPPPRKMHALALLPAAPGRPLAALLFGGERDSGLLDDLWLLTLPPAAAVAGAIGGGGGDRGGGGGAEVTGAAADAARAEQPAGQDEPAARQAHPPAEGGAACGAVGGSGGGGGGGGGGSGGGSGGAARWVQLRMKGGPSPRFGHAIAVLPRPPDAPEAPQPPAPPPPLPGAADGAARGARDLVAVFGGCMDQSSFPYLARSYVQTAELWLGDPGALAWFSVPQPDPLPPAGSAGAEAGAPPEAAAAAATAAALWPQERMCATLTPLRGGRALLLGGRWREGIQDDAWWLRPPNEMPSAAGVAPAAVASREPSASGGAAKPPPGPPASLLQSLLQPLRPKDAAAVGGTAGSSPAVAVPSAGPAAGSASAPGMGVPVGALDSQPGSPRQLSQAGMQASPALLEVGPSGPAAQAAAAAMVSYQAPTAVPPAGLPQQQQQQQTPPQQQQQAQLPTALPPLPQWSRLAQLQAAGSGLLQATGSADWSDLRAAIRNPAAALSSLTARLGNQLQPGLEALTQRLGPTGLLDVPARLMGPNAAQPAAPPPGPLAGLRAQMGLPAAAPAAAETAPGPGPGSGGAGEGEGNPLAHLPGLLRLGQQLLGAEGVGSGGGGGGAAGLEEEVLTSAARQSLTTAEAGSMPLAEVRLLAADYAALAGAELGRQLLEAMVAADAPQAQPPPPPSRWPADPLLMAAGSGALRLADIPELQRRYARLLGTEAA